MTDASAGHEGRTRSQYVFFCPFIFLFRVFFCGDQDAFPHSQRGCASAPKKSLRPAKKTTVSSTKNIRDIRDRIIGLESPPELEQPRSRCFSFAFVVFVSFVSFVVSSRRFRPGQANRQPPATQLRLVSHTLLRSRVGTPAVGSFVRFSGRSWPFDGWSNNLRLNPADAEHSSRAADVG